MDNWREKITRPISISPLITFRIIFGALMLFSTVRFWANGWIDSLYVKPQFYFTYMGFEWVKPLGDTGMHLLFLIMGLSAIGIMLGLLYRFSAILFFLSFTYVELIDVTNYLNHYYFVSIVAFLLILLPAGRCKSVDIWFSPQRKITHVPLWIVGVIRLQMAIVYFYAGLAKLTPEWMLEAIPMKIWLPAKSHLPLVGPLMYKAWVAYLFSWFGAAYDLLIPFFLISRKTRNYGFLAVLAFHICTAIFFPAIGMFPYVMMLSSLIFFSSSFHDKLLGIQRRANFPINPSKLLPAIQVKFLSVVLTVYFFIQIVVPLRFLLYPGHLFWYEEGYRFSWRVMLMEKSGNTFFYVKESKTGKTFEVENSKYLTPQQEKMMSTQPDMIIRYAHFLKAEYQKKGIKDPKIYAEGFVALNGLRSQPFIDPNIDLASQQLSFGHVQWILPFYKDSK